MKPSKLVCVCGGGELSKAKSWQKKRFSRERVQSPTQSLPQCQCAFSSRRQIKHYDFLVHGGPYSTRHVSQLSSAGCSGGMCGGGAAVCRGGVSGFRPVPRATWLALVSSWVFLTSGNRLIADESRLTPVPIMRASAQANHDVTVAFLKSSKPGVLERSKAWKENKGFILELNMSGHWPGTTVRLGHPKSHFPTGQQFREASLVTEQSKSDIKAFEKRRLVGNTR